MKFWLLVTLIFNTHALSPKEKEVLLATKEVGEKLKKALMTGVKSGGPLNAISTCNTLAPNIRNTQEDFTISRVSLKNRNPNNRPKEWMKDYIEKFHRSEIKEEYIFVRISDNTKGFLRPIKTNGMCLQCHGANINYDVNKKIKELYPNDLATGYKAGDIRGFFWTEFND